MRVVVIPGTTYAVTTATDCTVSTTDGVLIASCAAGEQTLFVAPGAEVEVSDDSALVTESFKGAPAGLSAVWGSIKKVSASLSSKLNVSTFNAHQANTTIHVTAQEREKWNSKQDNLTDESGNMTLAGNITVAGGTFDGTVNANGGINGYQVEWKFEDDQADSEIAVNAYNNLMDWGMQVMAGPTTTGSSISVSTKCNEERVFMMTPSASSADVTAGKDNVFQLCFTDPNQGAGSATYIAANMPESKIAVIYRNDDAYSQGIRDKFVSTAAENGLEIVYEGTFTKDTATDFSVQLNAAQADGADLVFLPIYYQPASVIFSQAKAMGYEPTFFGVDGMDGILTLEGFDTSLAEDVMVLTPFSADAQDEQTQSFVAKYTEKYGEVPNQFAADEYDVIYALKAALEAANCTPDMSNEEICDALVSAFQSLTFDGLTGKGMTWNTEGEVSKMPAAVIIKNGTYVSAELEAAEEAPAEETEAAAEPEATAEAEAAAEPEASPAA